jgi:hypothetical protein
MTVLRKIGSVFIETLGACRGAQTHNGIELVSAPAGMRYIANDHVNITGSNITFTLPRF